VPEASSLHLRAITPKLPRRITSAKPHCNQPAHEPETHLRGQLQRLAMHLSTLILGHALLDLENPQGNTFKKEIAQVNYHLRNFEKYTRNSSSL
jgi:hypothetical protein